MSVVLITGCNSGFGLHASLTFARQGHDVFATVRNLDRAAPLRDAAKAEDLELNVLRLDVRDAESVEGAIAEVVERTGRVDVCVNNAGLELRGPIEECSDDEVFVQFDTNVFGLLRVVRAVLPVMRAQRSGVIVNVGSLAGLVARPFGGLYSATKHAVEAISESLHFECALRHPRCRARARPVRDRVAHQRHHRGPVHQRFPLQGGIGPLRRRATAPRPGGPPRPAGDGGQKPIVAVAEDDDAGLRHLVGADADLVWSVRNGSTFEQYEQTIRAALDWWE